jgi:hypothetical protein
VSAIDDGTRKHLEHNVGAVMRLVRAMSDLCSGALGESASITEVLEDHGYEGDLSADPGELLDFLFESVLEIYGNARVTADTVDVRGVVVVTGVGGPHLEFEVSYNGDVEVRGYWGRDRITDNSFGHNALGDHLVELVGGWDR